MRLGSALSRASIRAVSACRSSNRPRFVESGDWPPRGIPTTTGPRAALRSYSGKHELGGAEGQRPHRCSADESSPERSSGADRVDLSVFLQAGKQGCCAFSHGSHSYPPVAILPRSRSAWPEASATDDAETSAVASLSMPGVHDYRSTPEPAQAIRREGAFLFLGVQGPDDNDAWDGGPRQSRCFRDHGAAGTILQSGSDLNNCSGPAGE